MVLNLITAVLILLPGDSSGRDSLEGSCLRILSGASGSLTGASNWQGSEYESLSFNGNADVIYRMKGKEWNRVHSGHWELGFTRFRDSLWQKHADQFRFQFLWSKDASAGRQSVTFIGRTQLFDSYYYYYDPANDRTVQQWAGTLLNPAEMEAGYGFCRIIRNTGTVNLAIATLRLRNEPVPDARHGVVSIDYGCSLQVLFLRPLNRYTDWHFSGRFFVNGTGSDNVTLDVLNRVTVRVWKFFQVRLESRAVYEPMFSCRMQYRNELLAGIFLDLNGNEFKERK